MKKSLLRLLKATLKYDTKNKSIKNAALTLSYSYPESEYPSSKKIGQVRKERWKEYSE